MLGKGGIMYSDSFAPNLAYEVAEKIGVNVSATHALLLPVVDLTSEVTDVETLSTARTIEGTLASDTTKAKCVS